jgi:hypothetical protein
MKDEKAKGMAAIVVMVPMDSDGPARELTEKIGKLVTESGFEALIRGEFLVAQEGPCDDPSCKSCRSAEKGAPANATLN